MAASVENVFKLLDDKRSRQSIGVTYSRTMPLPLDRDSLFRTLDELSTYALTSNIAYPGQLLAMVDEDDVNYYKVNSDGTVARLDNTTVAKDGIKKEIIGGVVTYSGDIAVREFSSHSAQVIDKIGISSDGSLSVEFRDLTADVLSGTLQINGNYFQTDDDTYVKNFSGKNAFIQAECSEKYYNRYGIACTGSRGYCILSALKTGSPLGNGALKLSGDLTDLQAFIEDDKTKNARFSLTLDSSAESMKYKVIQLSGQWAFLDIPIEMNVPGSDKDESYYTGLWDDFEDNGFYCPRWPERGNAPIPSLYGNHAEGAATKALQRATHAEGRNAIADIRYSHAEGTDTIAGGMASHAEGNSACAFGSNAHAEGASTNADGESSHAEGVQTIALGKGSHAEGSQVSAIGDFSSAKGKETIAEGQYSHAEGLSSEARGEGSHAEGLSSIAEGKCSHAEGFQVSAIGYCSNAQGERTIAYGSYSHAEGLSSQSVGLGSHAEGTGAIAIGKGSHAEGGDQVYAISECAHASGFEKSYAGTYLFDVKGVDDATNVITCNSVSGLSAGDYIAFCNSANTTLSSIFNTRILSIISDTEISVNNLPFKSSVLASNAFIFCPTKPLCGTRTGGQGAYVEGSENFAYTYSHAEGLRNFATGKFSHCQGIANRTGWGATAIGRGNDALGWNSIAMGGNGPGDSASTDYGTNSKVLASGAFSWSGTTSCYVVPEDRVGTFNVDPMNGLSGFYIGDQNLCSVISNEVAVVQNDVSEVSGVLSGVAEALKTDSILSGKISNTAEMSTIISAVVLIFSKLSAL